MKLTSLLKGLEYKVHTGDENVEINNVCYYSGKVKNMDAFVCIVGHNLDGHMCVNEAISKGAKVIIAQKYVKVKWGVCLVIVTDTEKALAIMSANLFGKPSDKLKIIGVTGTKGKTSVSYMIRALLTSNNIKCGLIGTVEIDNGKWVCESDLTTPSSYEIQRYLKQMVDNGCKYAVIEVSSQGVKKKRVYGIEFYIGIFTNIYVDHIGPLEHSDFNEYLYWKSKFFSQCRVGIVNSDDKHYKDIIEFNKCKWYSYGVKEDNDLSFYNFNPIIVNNKLGVEFALKGVYNVDLVVALTGKFTVYNVMAALLTINCLNIKNAAIDSPLESLVVPGRQETVIGPKGSFVIIDYAHNGKALESLLYSLRDYNPRRIILVFGCGGNRSKMRRYSMGEVAGKMADYIIITSDNPRNECPFSIINDIIKGIIKTLGKYQVEEDREKAIYKGISMAGPNDFVVIAGKGHEKYQIIGNEKIYFDDLITASEIIEKVKYGQNYSKRNS